MILMFGVTNVARSQICAVDTKQFALGMINCTHGLSFVNQVPKTSSYNPLVLGSKAPLYDTISKS